MVFSVKNAIKTIEGKRRQDFVYPQLFQPKVFDMDFPQMFVCGVFELPLLRNAQKRHKRNKKRRRYHGTAFSGHLAGIRRFHFFFSAPLEGTGG
jgi:hypothetical protein